VTLLLFSPQASNERGPKYLEAFIASLVAMPLRTRWSLGIGTREGRAVLLLRVPDSQQRRIAASLSNAYPGSSVTPIADNDRIHQLATVRTVGCSRLCLSPDVLPLRLHSSFVEEHSREAVDTVEAILEQVMTGRSGTVEAEVWLHLRPASRRVRERAAKYAMYINGRFPLGVMRRSFLRSVSSSRVQDRFATRLCTLLATPGDVLRPSIAEKLSQHLLQVSVELRVRAPADAQEIARRKIADLHAAFMQFLTGEYTVRLTTFHRRRRGHKYRGDAP
jgi:hypothetical protein